MAKADVYFFNANALKSKDSMSKVKGPKSLEYLGFNKKVKKNDKVCIKTHFGALENTRYLRPAYIRFLCDYVKEFRARPYAAESCGWGLPGAEGEYGGRASEKEYLEVALKHGFTKETMGAEILTLDGPIGIDYEIQKIKGKWFNEVLVAGRLREFDLLILASHFKGHSGAGFGGALKNLGIGCVSKGGKVQAHTGKKLIRNFEKCVDGCQSCIEICPTKSLQKDSNGRMMYNEETCRNCYMCVSVCNEEVFQREKSERTQFIERMIDNALGVVEFFGEDKIFYLNYAIDITFQCDCSGGSDVPFVQDIGILASKDPVAVDMACIDLTHKSAALPNSCISGLNVPEKDGLHEWFSYIPRHDYKNNEIDLNKESKYQDFWKIQLNAAEKLGLGTKTYNLIELTDF
jgi:uncharacterized Fe-S center protein